MFNIIKKEIDWAGRKLTIETGRIARQSNSVLITYGETTVLCNATADTKETDLDYFPLSVHYQEKAYAAGKIPGGFFKREGRPSEKETLTSRLIDRPIRPLFPEGFNSEVQVMCTLLSHDGENDPDIIALIGASCALSISEVPFLGPIAASRIAINGEDFIVNPTIEELKESPLDLTVSGTKDSILMVESEANGLTEEEMIEALQVSQQSFAPVIDLIKEFQNEAGKVKIEVKKQELEANLVKLQSDLESQFTDKIQSSYQAKDKAERKKALAELLTSAKELAESENETEVNFIQACFHNLEKKIVRNLTLNNNRIDGRKSDEIRQIEVETSILKRVHGSSLFTRGETQALAVITLGTEDDEQIIDSVAEHYKERFMLHYNFPAYSVGEISFPKSPGRREIGHGKLAKKALNPIMPSKEDFNYTVRIVSEIMESNGSSSMATVCSSSVAMLDAGVPIKQPVAGIAMGLIKEDDKFVVLSDIMGDEDHLGDMDFKVAGTATGITALQMDIKIHGINFDIIKQALSQAKDGRLHILEKMNNVIKTPNEELSQYAPIVSQIQIPESKIREVIGQGGKVIKKICEDFDVKISIEDNGNVNVSGVGSNKVNDTIQYIRDLIAEPEIGKIYPATVDKITNYGAFVNYLKNASGLVHISEFAEEKIASVEEFVSEGDDIKIKVIGKDGDKYRLSYKAVQDGEGILPEYANRNTSRKPGRPHRKDNRRGGDKRSSHKKSSIAGNPYNNEINDDSPKKKKKGLFW